MRAERTNSARKPLLAAVALVLGVSVLLTGCAGEAKPQASPKPAAIEAAKTPTPEPVVLPDCDAMNAAAQQEYEDYGPENFSAPAGEADLTVFHQVAGEAAKTAMSKAVQQQGCRWPVHMQGTVTEYVVELAGADRAPLIEALRSDGGVQASTLGDAEIFSYTIPADNPIANDTKVTYLFIGDIWALIFDYAGQREYAQAALDGILAANPSLAGKGADSEASGTSNCSGLSGTEALGKWGAGIAGGPWDLTGQFSDVKGYDKCAALSWIVLRPEPCCTRFSITPVLFFHHGEYVPAATVTGHAVDSEDGVQRVSDGELSVTYMWQGGDIAGPANTATSTYRWDEASGTITRSGALPPS